MLELIHYISSSTCVKASQRYLKSHGSAKTWNKQKKVETAGNKKTRVEPAGKRNKQLGTSSKRIEMLWLTNRNR